MLNWFLRRSTLNLSKWLPHTFVGVLGWKIVFDLAAQRVAFSNGAGAVVSGKVFGYAQ